jgi:methylenetetrahydrofolate reductase (NADPH)
MRISDIDRKRSIPVSFEFFPPRSEDGWEELFQTIKSLVPLHPSYVSITYGAGGGTRSRTHDLVVRIQRETGIPVVAHLTCVGSTRDEIQEIVEQYVEKGIHNILALRGDVPRGTDPKNAFQSGGFHHAADLVAFIKEKFPHIGVGVAGFPEGHPETPNRLIETDNLKTKIDAGADYIVTQLFFDNRDFYDFCERCHFVGIDVPIIAGIMPIISRRNMSRMAELAAGARFPAALLRATQRAHSDEYVRHVGVHWATEQVRDLIDHGVSGIHFYTLNRSRASREICEALGLKDYLNLHA